MVAGASPRCSRHLESVCAYGISRQVFLSLKGAFLSVPQATVYQGVFSVLF